MASTGVELTVQSERAFQKQPIFLNSKATRKSTRTKRWYKDVGLGFKTPRAAIDGQYIGECYYEEVEEDFVILLNYPPYRQEVPMDWSRINSRTYLDWKGCLDKDEPNNYHSS